MPKIGIRFDDICPTMNEERFLKTVELVSSYGITGLLGVVPDNLDPDLKIEEPDPDFFQKIKSLREKGWVIGMHGVQHKFCCYGESIVTTRMDSEFAGEEFEKQKEKLESGLSTLKKEGIDTSLFFAPGHSYDKKTIKALYELGFVFISDGRSNRCYFRNGIKFIPCKVYGYPHRIKGNVTVALHTNKMDESAEAVLKEFLETNKKYLVSYSELMNEKCGISVFERMYEWAYVKYQRIRAKLRQR